MIWFAERGVIGSQRPGNFFQLLFFVGIGENGLTANYPISTTIDNHSHPSSQTRASMLAQLRIGGSFGDCEKVGMETGAKECPHEGTRNGTYDAVILEKGERS